MNQSATTGSGRVWVSCPGCEEKYVMEVARIPVRGGSLSCRICGAKVPLPPRPPLAQDAARPSQAPGAAAAPPAVPARSSQAAVKQTDAAPALSAPQARASVPRAEITCPHCGRGFVPGAAAQAPAPKESPAPRASSGNKTVLIAEDTEFFLTLARDTLTARYKTLCARTAAEALRYLKDERIDLLLLDLTLDRENDGLQVLATAAPLGVPCLIFTARSESDMWGEPWQRLKDKGASDLLLKGMNMEEQLISKVDALLSTRGPA